MHLRNVQSHSSSRTVQIQAMQDRTTDMRSRSGSPRDLMANPKMMMTGVNGQIVASGVMMTVGDLGRRPCRQDAMRPLRPAGPTIRRTRLTSFSLVFALRHHRWAAITSCFARAGVAELVYPDPSKWKQSWETVYRSLMPHRDNIIQDEDRVRSDSELTAMRLPHAGAWRSSMRSPASSTSLLWTICLSNSLFSWASWRSAGRTSGRPRGHIAVFSPAKRILGTINTGASSPKSRAANYRTTFALSRSRRSFGRTTPTSIPPSAS